MLSEARIPAALNILFHAKAAEGDQFKTLAMKISISGPYAALQSFLSNIEKHVRVLNLTSINITAGEDANQAGQLNFAIEGETYFVK